MDIKMIITLSAYEMGQSEHYAHSEINPFLSPTPRPSLGPEFTSQFSQIWTGTNSCIVGVSSAQFLRLLLCCLYVTEVPSWYGSDGTVVEIPKLWFKDFTLELDGKFDLKHAITQSGVRACAKPLC